MWPVSQRVWVMWPVLFELRSTVPFQVLAIRKCASTCIQIPALTNQHTVLCAHALISYCWSVMCLDHARRTCITCVLWLGYMRSSEMEGERQGRPPTVVPLTMELIQKLLQQQQQQKGTVLSAAKQVSQASTARGPGQGHSRHVVLTLYNNMYSREQQPSIWPKWKAPSSSSRITRCHFCSSAQ